MNTIKSNFYEVGRVKGKARVLELEKDSYIQFIFSFRTTFNDKDTNNDIRVLYHDSLKNLLEMSPKIKDGNPVFVTGVIFKNSSGEYNVAAFKVDVFKE